MAALSEDEIRWLINEGVASDKILAYQNGNADLSATMQINMARSRNPNTSFKVGAKAPNSVTNPRSQAPFTNAVGGTAVRAPDKRPPTGQSTLGNVLASLLPQSYSNMGKKVGSIATGVAKAASPGIKAIAQGVARGVQGGPKTAASNLGAPKKSGTGSIIGGGGGIMGDGGGVGGDLAYDAEEFQQPTFTARDFTDQANQNAAAAYNPRFAAIDAAAAGSQSQYKRADAITAGLYENLVKSVAQSGEAAKARYAAAGQEQGNRTQELQANIGNTYNGAQNQMADLMKQLGQGEAAPQVLQRGVADSGWNQSQAATQGAAQQAAISQQGQGQQDYMANVANAERTQGTVRREDLLNDLTQTLQGYDQQRMGLEGDKMTTAMDIANRLSDRDLQLQQMNYGGYKDAYGARADAAQTQLGLAQSNRQFSAQQAQNQLDNQYRTSQAGQAQANADRDYDLRQSQYSTDLATQQAQIRMEEEKNRGSQAYEQYKPADQDPVSRTINAIADSMGGDTGTAQQYYDAVGQLTSSIDQASGGKAADILSNQFTYVDWIARNAAAKGLDVRTAQRAAAAYYVNVLRPGN